MSRFRLNLSLFTNSNKFCLRGRIGYRRHSFVPFLLGALILCAGGSVSEAASLTANAQAKTEPKSAQAPASASEKVLLFIGDSLTAGYGVRKEEAFPALVEKILIDKGFPVKVTNGGISGSVSAESDRRVRWFLKTKPQILVLALGANDALKGTPPAVIKANLTKAIDLAQANNVKVVLAGIRIFSNFGADYSRDFENVFKELAKERKLTFIPFLLEGVALDKSLNLSDGKHPNAEGHKRVANTIVKALEPLL